MEYRKPSKPGPGKRRGRVRSSKLVPTQRQTKRAMLGLAPKRMTHWPAPKAK